MRPWQDWVTFEEPKLVETKELRDEALLLACLESLVKGIVGVQSVDRYNQRKSLREV